MPKVNHIDQTFRRDTHIRRTVQNRRLDLPRCWWGLMFRPLLRRRVLRWRNHIRLGWDRRRRDGGVRSRLARLPLRWWWSIEKVGWVWELGVPEDGHHGHVVDVEDLNDPGWHYRTSPKSVLLPKLTWMRLFLESQTRICPSGSNTTPWGRWKSPGCSPSLPMQRNSGGFFCVLTMANRWLLKSLKMERTCLKSYVTRRSPSGR